MGKSNSFPRYMTFKAGELDQTLQELGASRGLVQRGAGRSGLIKALTCPVSFPDGQAGTCAYTRGGPAWHIFGYEYRFGAERKAYSLPRHLDTRRLPNDEAALKEIAREIAPASFEAAVERERREYFERAAEGPFRQKRPEGYQMKAERAKRLSGKYALCCLMGTKLLPVTGQVYDDLADANAQWRERSDQKLVVACCNRLDRRWEVPCFNPLYGEFDPRLEMEMEVFSEVCRVVLAPAPVSLGGTAVPGEEWEYLGGPDSDDEEGGEET